MCTEIISKEELIKAIKSVSDIAGIRGKVTTSDYMAWYNMYHKKN